MGPACQPEGQRKAGAAQASSCRWGAPVTGPCELVFFDAAAWASFGLHEMKRSRALGAVLGKQAAQHQHGPADHKIAGHVKLISDYAVSTHISGHRMN